MHINRRSLFAHLPALAAMATLPGCAQVDGLFTKTIPVTLATAQAEASTIATALETIAGGVEAALPAGIKAEVVTGLAALKDAVSVFTAIPAGGNYAAAAQAVIKAITPLVALIPLPAGTQMAIVAGLGIISALLAGVASVPAPATAPVATGVGAPAVVAGPIPVPLS